MVPEIDRFAHGEVNYLVIVGTGTWRVTMASWRNSGEQATLCSNCNAAYPPLP